MEPLIWTWKWSSRQRYINRAPFRFSDQDTIESVITFRIDSRTIKRDNLVLEDGYQVPLDELVMHCI